VVIVDHDGVGPDRLLGRWSVHATCAEIERGGVQRALHLATLDPPVSEGGVLVRARVVDGEDLPVLCVEHSDRWLGLDAEGLPRGSAERGRFGYFSTLVRITQ
jgi:hypothetical protein